MEPNYDRRLKPCPSCGGPACLHRTEIPRIIVEARCSNVDCSICVYVNELDEEEAITT